MERLPITQTNPNTVRIRAAEPTDAAAISALIGDHGVFEGTLQTPYAAVASRVERFSKIDPYGVSLVAVARDTNHAELIVGQAGLFMVHPSLRRMHVRGLGMAVAKDWQGRGVGSQLLGAITDWADNWAHVLRLELTVFADNTRAIALYQRHGFVKEGHMMGHALRDGAYVDAWAMARLHPKPPVLIAK
jgi:L-phenylalanine/L-methionine N-acetyltransferase